MIFRSIILLLALFASACQRPAAPPSVPATMAGSSGLHPFWRNANIYFLLTDRFYNGDKSNDFPLGRKNDGAMLRGFAGGDLKGITVKIREGYFDALGVTAIWFTPIVEQIHGKVDEGTGSTYGFHGYWARDWTRIDPNFGTEADLRELVETAHQHGIRLLMDVVINHTGPVTATDAQWPGDWVRTGPRCSYRDFETTVTCTLTDNLPDIRTDSKNIVDIPAFLREKWAAEGRLQQEQAELDAFFARTGYPRAPRYYLIKWLTDWVRKFGIDGYRFDTAKHIEPEVSAELSREAGIAFREWKARNPRKKLGDLDFFMVGEVYGFGVGGPDRSYDFGDRQVDFFANGLQSLINFSFKSDAQRSPDELFQRYSDALNGGPLQGVGVLNYISSHDDGGPFDPERRRAMEAGTKLLLSPGAAQVYYGDESMRPLVVAGAFGDANLRSFMNWEEIDGRAEKNGTQVRDVLEHWRRLGRFRRAHLAVGAGVHQRLQESPYVFSRVLDEGAVHDRVVVGLELPVGKKSIPAGGVFKPGTRLKDYYSGGKAVVGADGNVKIDSGFGIVLLGEE